MDGAGRVKEVSGWIPLVNVMQIVAVFSFPTGNHPTLIKAGRGNTGGKKDGSVSTLGKSSLERLEDSKGNSSGAAHKKGQGVKKRGEMESYRKE